MVLFANMSYILFIVIIVLIIAPVYLIWAIYSINLKLRRAEWLKSQEYTFLRIDVPRNNDKAPLAAEQMFAALHGIFSDSAKFQSIVSFEIVAKDKFIQFYIHTPVHLKDFVEGQVYAQYPTVEINEVDDYVTQTDMSDKHFSVNELKMNKPDAYPIKQFTDFEVDPISGITSVMAKLNAGEQVWLQMLIRPVGDEWQERGHKMVNLVRGGRKPNHLGISNSVSRFFLNLLNAFVAQVMRPGETSTDNKEIKLPASVEEALKSIEQKITKLGFRTRIRIASIGDDPVSVRLRNQNIGAAFKQFNTTNLNGFRTGEIHVDRPEDFKDYSERSFEGNGHIFNIAELASIYHLPHSSVATPSIVWSGSKKGEPPANLPLTENTPTEELTVIGETNFRNVFRTFGIKQDDRRRHIYIIGKSGVGKSVLIENMAYDDVQKGRGVIIVDPHGELADKILACIPDHRVRDVVVFDPSDRDFPIAFNLLESVDDDFKSIVASGFVGIFKKIFGESWGPRLEHIMRNTVLALLECPDSTMLDIPRMLTNGRFRDKIVDQVKDPIIREFWKNEFSSFDSKFRTEAVSPILNKVGQFLSSSTIRNIVGQPKSTIDIRTIMDEQKIMIVNLSRGKIGEDNSALLGAMMITKIQLAAMSRANVTIDQRPDSYLYVDEFQNFATESFATILAEARKYNLNLTMAHQYIAQLKDEVREAVFGNAGTIISFRVGGADADILVKEFAPVFENNDLVNLDKYHVYIKLLIDGISCPAFSARTLPPVSKLAGNIAQVIEHSHQKYSNARSYVEETINSRSRNEESEMLAEAEAFKKGGLEAILIKRDAPSASAPRKTETPAPSTPVPAPRSNPTAVSISAPKHDSDIIPQVEPEKTPTAESEAPEKTDDQADSVPAPEKNEPKVLKTDGILNGKIYKERTARGGVKWYLGEEVDEEKLAQKGIAIGEDARGMIEKTKELFKKGKGSRPIREEKHHIPQDNNRRDEKKEDRPALPSESKKAGETELEKNTVSQEGKSPLEATSTTVEPAESHSLAPTAPQAVVEAVPHQPVINHTEEQSSNSSATSAVDLNEGEATKIE